MVSGKDICPFCRCDGAFPPTVLVYTLEQMDLSQEMTEIFQQAKACPAIETGQETVFVRETSTVTEIEHWEERSTRRRGFRNLFRTETVQEAIPVQDELPTAHDESLVTEPSVPRGRFGRLCRFLTGPIRRQNQRQTTAHAADNSLEQVVLNFIDGANQQAAENPALQVLLSPAPPTPNHILVRMTDSSEFEVDESFTMVAPNVAIRLTHDANGNRRTTYAILGSP